MLDLIAEMLSCQFLVRAASVSLSSFLVGLVLSYTASMPAGASIVLVNLAFFLIFTAAGRLR